MPQERIKLEMSTMDAIMALVEGNPGAIEAVTTLMLEAPKIDPDNALGALGVLLSFDSLGLYGSRLYMLWSDACGRDSVKTLTVLRAWQLGILTEPDIAHAVENYGNGIHHDALLDLVRIKLPNFAAA